MLREEIVVCSFGIRVLGYLFLGFVGVWLLVLLVLGDVLMSYLRDFLLS